MGSAYSSGHDKITLYAYICAIHDTLSKTLTKIIGITTCLETSLLYLFYKRGQNMAKYAGMSRSMRSKTKQNVENVPDLDQNAGNVPELD